jgi:DNA polymerase III subunit beta
MKFTLGRDALGEAVAFVSRALPSRPVVPVLSGMLLEAAAGSLTLSCFDYEVSARVRVDADVSEPGSALVPGRLLAEITRSLPPQPAQFCLDADMVNLTCGSAEFGLVCLPAEDYPALPPSPGPIGSVDGGMLATAVAQVATAASRDDTLPMLTAVCLDIAGDVMTLAATDRYRVAARDVSFSPAGRDPQARALVPAKFLADAARTFAPGLPVTVALGADGGGGQFRAAGGGTGVPRQADGLVCFESGNRRLTGRLIPGEFIRYRGMFGDEFGCQADLRAGPVIEAVRRAALVAERAGPVRLSFGPDQVVIEAHAEGRARAAETVVADFAGDEPAIAFNPHYLLDGLTAAAAEAGPGPPAADAGGSGTAEDREGRIRLRFNTRTKPALITWASADEDGRDASTFRYMLVPLRVPERG